METMLPYAIETELRVPPPRPARLPPSTSTLLMLAGLLLSIFFAAGVRVDWEAINLMHLNVAGRTVLGRVDSVKSVTATRPGMEAVDALVYSYRWPFASQQRRIGQAQSPHGAFHVGDGISVRCVVWYGRELTSPGSKVSASKIAFLAGCGVLLSGICALMLTRMLRWRANRLHMLRWGEATIGTIVFKHAQNYDSAHYFVRFGYIAKGQPQERDEQVTTDIWKRAEVGQTITVLFDPAHPAEGILYKI